MKATKIRVTLGGENGPVVVHVFAHLNDNQPNKDVIAEAVRSTHPELKHLPIVEMEEFLHYERRIPTSTPSNNGSDKSINAIFEFVRKHFPSGGGDGKRYFITTPKTMKKLKDAVDQPVLKSIELDQNRNTRVPTLSNSENDE